MLQNPQSNKCDTEMTIKPKTANTSSTARTALIQATRIRTVPPLAPANALIAKLKDTTTPPTTPLLFPVHTGKT